MASVDPTPNGLPSHDCSRSSATTPATRIYLELARSPHARWRPPRSPRSLGLHPNTVRPHLERMRDVGLLDVATDGRGERRPAPAPLLVGGRRPVARPRAADHADAGAHGAGMAERLDASPDDAVAVGARRGRSPRRAVRRVALGARGAGRRPRSTRLRSRRGRRRARRPRRGHRRVRQLPVRRVRRRPPRARVRAAPRARRRVRRRRWAMRSMVEFCPLFHRTPCQVSIGAGRAAAIANRSTADSTGAGLDLMVNARRSASPGRHR